MPAPHPAPPARIERVAVLTRDRPLSARHVLDTAAALDRGERRVELILVDDSRAPGARDEVAARVDGRRGGGGVPAIVLGPGERRHHAHALVAGGIEPAVVELALFDPFGLDSTPGASRNFLHLWSVARPFLSVDDDMPLEPGTPPGTRGATLEVGEGDPTRFWFFDQEPRPAPLSRDALLGGHESLLGHTAAGAARALGVDLRAPRSEALAQRAERERIVATWTGFAGDVATPNVLAYLKQRGDARRSLVRDASFYRRAFASRQVIRAPRALCVADGSFWSPGVTAYDPTALLPPFLPALRGEGLVFGALIRASSGLLGYLPIAVRHRPAEERRFDRAAVEQSAASFALSTLLVRWLHRHRRTADRDPAAALRAAGDHLRELAGGDADGFAARVRAERRRYVVDVATELMRCLADGEPVAGPWVDDVDRYLEVAQEAATSAPGSPSDLPDPERARCFVLAFADLVRAWPDVVAVAREIAQGN